MSELKLEVGKFYRAENGYKIYIYSQYQSLVQTEFVGVSPECEDAFTYARDGVLLSYSSINRSKLIPGFKIISEWEESMLEPERKVYKLREMLKVWFTDGDAGDVMSKIVEVKEDAVRLSEFFPMITILAITRADATEFYEGEGL